jgi:hypothetical protein
MKRLIIPNHVILPSSQFYTLISVFPDTTPQQVHSSKPVLDSLRSVRLVLDTELSANNKIQVTRSLAVPVLRYCFGTINWHRELRNLDRKKRKLLTIHGQHHPKADVDCLYVPRKWGRRELMKLEDAYIVEVLKVKEYVDSKEHKLSSATERNKTKDSIAQKMKERWQGRRMHGHFPHNIDEVLLSNERSYNWRKFGDIKGETESAIVAAQVQALSAYYFKNKC